MRVLAIPSRTASPLTFAREFIQVTGSSETRTSLSAACAACAKQSVDAEVVSTRTKSTKPESA